jgi:hypothetical protein
MPTVRSAVLPAAQFSVVCSAALRVPILLQAERWVGCSAMLLAAQAAERRSPAL